MIDFLILFLFNQISLDLIDKKLLLINFYYKILFYLTLSKKRMIETQRKKAPSTY